MGGKEGIIFSRGNNILLFDRFLYELDNVMPFFSYFLGPDMADFEEVASRISVGGFMNHMHAPRKRIRAGAGLALVIVVAYGFLTIEKGVDECPGGPSPVIDARNGDRNLGLVQAWEFGRAFRGFLKLIQKPQISRLPQCSPL